MSEGTKVDLTKCTHEDSTEITTWGDLAEGFRVFLCVACGNQTKEKESR